MERYWLEKAWLPSVGLIPGKMTDPEGSIRSLAELLGMEEEAIKEKLSASWVKEDSFVPIKTISKEGMPDITDMLLGRSLCGGGKPAGGAASGAPE